MKNILITGKNSYIGTSLENWLMREPDQYKVDSIDMKDGSWKESDFSQYDVVFHVAGIAHIKETGDNQNLYYKVNRDLACETAQKAKKDGVEQFIFLSSMSVYGIDQGGIDKDTPLKPSSNYGRSKFEAEDYINRLQDDRFTISILRPPMVYGKGCRGNYPRLVGLALKTPVFPNVDNKRSMIYIDNMSEFVKRLIDSRSGGVFFPQNTDYVNTSEMVKIIADAHGRRIRMTTLFNWIIQILIKLNFGVISKVFGSLYYDSTIADSIQYMDKFDFRMSILMSEDCHLE